MPMLQNPWFLLHKQVLSKLLTYFFDFKVEAFQQERQATSLSPEKPPADTGQSMTAENVGLNLGEGGSKFKPLQVLCTLCCTTKREWEPSSPICLSNF